MKKKTPTKAISAHLNVFFFCAQTNKQRHVCLWGRRKLRVCSVPHQQRARAGVLSQVSACTTGGSRGTQQSPRSSPPLPKKNQLQLPQSFPLLPASSRVHPLIFSSTLHSETYAGTPDGRWKPSGRLQIIIQHSCMSYFNKLIT